MQPKIPPYLTVVVVSTAILGVSYGILSYLGDPSRAQEAGIQGARWFLAGAVIAAIGDTISNGSSTEIMILGALALVALIVCEYFLLGVEEETSQSRSPP